MYTFILYIVFLKDFNAETLYKKPFRSFVTCWSGTQREEIKIILSSVYVI